MTKTFNKYNIFSLLIQYDLIFKLLMIFLINSLLFKYQIVDCYHSYGGHTSITLSKQAYNLGEAIRDDINQALLNQKPSNLNQTLELFLEVLNSDKYKYLFEDKYKYTLLCNDLRDYFEFAAINDLNKNKLINYYIILDMALEISIKNNANFSKIIEILENYEYLEQLFADITQKFVYDAKRVQLKLLIFKWEKFV